MRTSNATLVTHALRAWLDGDKSEGNAERLAEYMIKRAIEGHFGFFRLVLDLVDGKLRKTAEDEMTYEADCLLIVTEETEESISSKAA